MFSLDPLVEKKQGPEAMPKFLIVMCIYGVYATVSVLWGHSLGALVYLKTKFSTAATPQ